MESLYAKYIKEREGREIIEKDYGFITYSIEDEYIFIGDLYIVPEERRNGHVKELTQSLVDLAKEYNKKYLMATVCPHASNPDISIKTINGIGGKFLHIKNDLLYFIKEVK